MNSPKPIDERVVDLEMSVMYLQQGLDELNDALLGQQSQIDLIQEVLQRLEGRFLRLEESEERSPDEERPPHY